METLQFTREEVAEMLQGHKIQAIKSVRERTSLGLLESKLLVEAGMTKLAQVIPDVEVDVNEIRYQRFVDHLYLALDNRSGSYHELLCDIEAAINAAKRLVF